jgi:hypothetical protein
MRQAQAITHESSKNMKSNPVRSIALLPVWAGDCYQGYSVPTQSLLIACLRQGYENFNVLL